MPGKIGLNDAGLTSMARGTDGVPVNIAADPVTGELIVTTAGGAGATEATLQDVKDAVELIDDSVYEDGVGTPVKGMLIMGTDGTNPQAVSVNSDGELKVNLETADIEIGAVEIKDASSDVRVEVSDANTARTTGSKVLSVQNIDADGDVPNWSDLTDVKTATEKIDDLQGALKSVDTDELITRVTDSAGVEINPAEEDGNLADIKNAVELIDDLQGALKSVDSDELITRVTDSSGTEINPAKEDGNLADIKNAVELIDDWDESDRAKVNPIVGQAGVSADSGVVDSGTQRITVATDDTLMNQVLDAIQAGLAVERSTHSSPIDFTAAYTSSSTITLTGYPTDLTKSVQIMYVKQKKSDNSYAMFINGHNCTFGFSAGVITIYGAGSPFASGDEYQIGLRVQDKAYDSSQNTLMTTEQSPEKDWFTDPVTLVSEQNLTDMEADFGSVIDVRTYKTLILYIAGDCNDSVDCTLYAYTLPTASGSEYTSQDAGFSSSVALWTGAGTDFLHEYRLDVEAHAFIQLKAKHTSNSGTTGDLSIMIAKRY